MFRAYPAHLQEVHFVIVYMRSLLSFLTSAQDSHLQTVTIRESSYIQLRSGPPEDEQGMLETCREFYLMYYM
jgi:hypothetical protein